MTPPPAAGATGEDRILALDYLRGVAVLGILAMNIVHFAMPVPAYSNPAAYGGATGLDLIVWAVDFILVDGKMRGLFSFLFGASILLIMDRAEAQGQNPVRIHLLRMLWLLVFGLAHLWLIWSGDVLSLYAIIGVVALCFRHHDIPRLIGAGVALLIVQVLIGVLYVASVWDSSPAEMVHAFGIPDPQWIVTQIALYRGPYLTLLADRWAHANLSGIVLVNGPETLAYMLFGMAALRSGMMRGGWPVETYRRWARIGFGVTVPAYALLALYQVATGFSLFAVTTTTMLLTIPLRVVMIVAWVALLLLLLRPDSALMRRLAAAGRMAFTNYIATSLICTTLFYGHGLGWYGSFSRAALVPVVLAIWALILRWSQPWLRRYRFGPMEWLWRSLARGRLQPMHRTPAKPSQ